MLRDIGLALHCSLSLTLRDTAGLCLEAADYPQLGYYGYFGYNITNSCLVITYFLLDSTRLS